MIRWEKIWRFNAAGSTYTDFSDEQRVDSPITLMQAAGDYVYLGLARRAIGFMTQFSVVGSYTGITVEYYADSGGWKKCILLSSTLLDQNGYCQWLIQNDMTLKEFTATFPHTASPPESGISLFWYRIKATTVTSAAILSKIRAIPYVMYTTADEVASDMSMKGGGFDYQNQPTVFQVEDTIRKKEARIDYMTKKSWRFNAVVDEEYPFNINGIKLQGWPIIEVYSMSIWNGGSWETKIQGRQSDYFGVDQWGFLKFSRFFALPARFAYIPPGLGRWDFGEFAWPIHISYSWGRDPERDKQFGQASEIASKLTACDLYTSWDKTIYTRSGIDHVTYDRKIETWAEKADNALDELRSVFSEGD